MDCVKKTLLAEISETVDLAKSSNLLRAVNDSDGSIGVHEVTLEKIASGQFQRERCISVYAGGRAR